MSWLVIQKVLPPLQVGHPPNYRTIVEAQRREQSVGWEMLFNGKKVGWALNTAVRLPSRLTEVRSRVHFHQLPLSEMKAGWFESLLRVGNRSIPNLEMEARSSLMVDSLGRLVGIDSSVRLEPLQEVIQLQGTVDETILRLTLRFGDFTHPLPPLYIPPDALLSDALSPQTQLPGLREGQTWTVPVYNPLRPPNSPMEIFQATVSGTALTIFGGRTEEVWLVIYQRDPGSQLGGDRSDRGRIWVRRDGTVLKQQVRVFDSDLTFIRLSDQQTAAMEDAVGSRRSVK